MRRTPRNSPLIPLVLFLAGLASVSRAESAEPLRVGVFSVDASPPVGSPLAYDPTKGVQWPLAAKGIVLLGDQQPIVLCAVDWIGIANDGHKVFRKKLAAAAGTDPSRVAVHTLHQHDAPRCDFSATTLLEEQGLAAEFMDRAFALSVMDRAAQGVAEAVKTARPVSHLGLGTGIVEKVASNRRVMGPDGKVAAVRYTATRDPELQAAPVGTIDPVLKLISLWDGEKPVVVLTYYATHPQSYYRTGLANPDFPGMARDERQQATGIPHIHFNGAGGNIGAGKWNDGSPENRAVLADRVAAGMRQAWESIRKEAISSSDLQWDHVPVALPVAPHLHRPDQTALLNDKQAPSTQRAAAAYNLAWMTRREQGETIDVTCLRLGSARLLHLPGELFVEYQLAAQALRPESFVALAAYGDYAPGYIGTEIAYSEGGYETSPRASRVAPAVEGVLMEAIEKLLRE